MKSLRRTLLIATAALLLTTLSFSQTEVDQKFLSEAAQAGMAKINMAYLALQHAQNEQVKEYARQILNDYGQAQSDLIYVANQHGVVLPKRLNATDAEALEALSQLHGAAFDKAFMQTMVNDDKSGVSKLEQQATKLDNPAIMKWANDALPALQSTLDQAQKVAPAVGVHPKQKDGQQAAAKGDKQATDKGEQQSASNAGESADAAQQKTGEQPASGAGKPSNTAAPKYEQY